MSQVDEDSWPLGFSCHIKFDFNKAFSNIKDQLDPEFLKNEWTTTLHDVLGDCHDALMKIDANDSYLFVQITFLDMLWECLFGRVRGPSPWKSIRQGLLPGILYGDDDIFDLRYEMSSACSDEATDEDVLYFLAKELGRHEDVFGIRVAMKSAEHIGQIFQRRAA